MSEKVEKKIEFTDQHPGYSGVSDVHVSELVHKFESFSSRNLHLLKKTNSPKTAPHVAISIPRGEQNHENSSSILINFYAESSHSSDGDSTEDESSHEEQLNNHRNEIFHEHNNNNNDDGNNESSVPMLDLKKKSNDKRTEFKHSAASPSLSSFVCLDSKAFLKQVNYEESLSQKDDDVNNQNNDSQPLNSSDHRIAARENFLQRYSIKKAAVSGHLKATTSNLDVEKEEKYARMRKELIEELIQTERDYVRDLEIAINVFLTPVRKQKLLSSYEIVSLFSNLETLLPLNKSMLEDLEQAIKYNSTDNSNPPLYSQWVGEIFQAYTPKMNTLYSTYCSNQPNIHSRLISYKNHVDFKKFLDLCYKREECRKLELDSFLIFPLQRICKYPLFFKQLITYTPECLNDGQYSVLIQTQKCIEEMVAQVNSKVKEVENLAKLVEVLFKLENGSDFFQFIVDDKHEFLQEGTFNINGLRSYIFLFSNLLLFCNIRSSSAENANDFCIQELNLPYQPFDKNEEKLRAYLCLYLRDCNIITSNNTDESIKNDFVIEHKDKSYTISCHNKSAKTSWSSRLKKLITECKTDQNITIKRKPSTIISLSNSPPVGMPTFPTPQLSTQPPVSPKGGSKGFLKRKKSIKPKKVSEEEMLRIEVDELKKQLSQANILIGQLTAENEALKLKLSGKIGGNLRNSDSVVLHN